VRFGSLFSGIGGFDLGFERAGMECVWQVEIDKDCQRVLNKHFPDSERFEDVSTVREFPAVDVICGGFPCQDLSVAGKRKGLAGERSGLWFEFLRIAQSNLPRFLVIENVPGLLSSDEGRDFAVILRGLVECGYCLAWRIIDAQYDGVAQRRRRVFIVGSLGNGSCAEILFESESVSWNPPTRREARAGTTGVARTSPTLGESNYKPTKSTSGAQIDFCIPDVAWALQERDAKGSDSDTKEGHLIVSMPLKAKANSSHDESHETYVCATLNSGGNSGGFRSEPGEHLIAGPLTANYGKQPDNSDRNGGPPNIISFAQNTRDEVRLQGDGRISGALSNQPGMKQQTYIAFTERTRKEGRTLETQEELAYAITNPGSGGRTHSRQIAGNFGVRRLTPRECERLQGFPDDWTRYDASGKEISDSARYRMLGNAVAVPCAEWIGRRILEANERME